MTFENSSRCLVNAAAKQSDRPLGDVVAMMSSPADPRWMEEAANSEGIFSHKISTLYTDTRKDIEQLLQKIQESLDKVPVRQRHPELLQSALGTDTYLAKATR